MTSNLQANSTVHLWIYNHPFHGVTDQIEYFLMIMRQNGYQVSVGNQPRIDALNVVIENFSESTSEILINFCRTSGKRVGVIMTEHLDFIGEQIYIHGDPLWNDNDYMHPATQVARIKNLMDCVQFIQCFFVLGDLPELLNINEMLPGVAVRTLPFPKFQPLSTNALIQDNNLTADMVFAGVVTSYRADLLGQLEGQMSVTCPGTFVSRRVRDNLSRSAKIVLNIPQRKDWKWLSLMRVMAALRCGRATVSLGTSDNSKISACCTQLDITQADWLDSLREYVSHWDTTYQHAFENYEAMAIAFEQEKPFPSDIFEYWAVIEQFHFK
ncbi:MAG: hypothetical protein M0R41_15870 [Methylobacter tundripaludum]|jgi:hypothetical protein|uniref:Glycosyl transferase family 1 n=1 Tax=Methylobacter tundripaludum TaxID=173365 RepID=A0A2S6H2B6_9GAMM|nr:hypothetical protein [Methylobacter tundripaludum]MCK9637751.1 hypothetical protein [Methylobacter tundripaludum]PPK71570.1 hypothetical protein B0F88_10794 [Methylobacter tundripaludum]